MAIKKAKYEVNENVIHFETDDRMVNILDSQDNLIGSLRELAFEGKVVNSGEFQDIKHAGVYRVKGLSGMPQGVPSDKECLLTVQAIGNADNPDLIFYKIITPNGVVLENTVSGSRSSGWGSGGVNLQNTIKDINSSIGDVNNLKTNAKNISDSLNELKKEADGSEAHLNNLQNSFDKHNHDDRYVNQDGDTMTGDLKIKGGTIVLGNDVAYTAFNNGGNRTNIAKVDKNNNVVLGDDQFNVEVRGKGLKFNGEAVVTEKNIYTYSPKIDTDAFVKVAGGNVNGTLNFSSNAHLTFDTSGKDNTIFELKNGWLDNGKLSADSNGTLKYSREAGSSFEFSPRDGLILNNTPGITITNKRSDGHEGRITWARQNDTGEYTDSGIWLAQPQWGGWAEDEKEHTVGWYNGRTGQSIAQYGAGTNGEAVRIFHSPYIGEHGSRLFIQNEQPSGDIPYGSVWIGF